jgi:hypothetical protein
LEEQSGMSKDVVNFLVMASILQDEVYAGPFIFYIAWPDLKSLWRRYIFLFVVQESII